MTETKVLIDKKWLTPSKLDFVSLKVSIVNFKYYAELDYVDKERFESISSMLLMDKIVACMDEWDEVVKEKNIGSDSYRAFLYECRSEIKDLLDNLQ